MTDYKVGDLARLFGGGSSSQSTEQQTPAVANPFANSLPVTTQTKSLKRKRPENEDEAEVKGDKGGQLKGPKGPKVNSSKKDVQPDTKSSSEGKDDASTATVTQPMAKKVKKNDGTAVSADAVENKNKEGESKVEKGKGKGEKPERNPAQPTPKPPKKSREEREREQWEAKTKGMTPEEIEAYKKKLKEERARKEQINAEKAEAVKKALEVATSVLKTQRKGLLEKFVVEKKKALRDGSEVPELDPTVASTLDTMTHRLNAAQATAQSVMLATLPPKKAEKLKKQLGVQGKMKPGFEERKKDGKKTGKTEKQARMDDDDDDDDNDDDDDLGDSEDESMYGADMTGRHKLTEAFLRSMDITTRLDVHQASLERKRAKLKRAAEAGDEKAAELLERMNAQAAGLTDDIDEIEDEVLEQEQRMDRRLARLAAREKDAASATGDTSERDIRTVFIGNVPVDTTVKEIKKLLASCGKVESVRFRSISFADPKLPKKIAFRKHEFHEKRDNMNAYAVMESKDAVDKVLQLKDVVLREHHLRFDRVGPGKPKLDQKRCVFVGNLPFDANDEPVRRFFSDCGNVTAVRLVRDKNFKIGKGFGFVEFENPDSLVAALTKDGEEFQGRELRVTKASEQAALKQTLKAVSASKNARAKNAERRIAQKKQKASGMDDEDTSEAALEMRARNQALLGKGGAKGQGAFQRAIQQGRVPSSIAALAASGSKKKKPRHVPREGSLAVSKPWMGMRSAPGVALGRSFGKGKSGNKSNSKFNSGGKKAGKKGSKK